MSWIKTTIVLSVMLSGILFAGCIFPTEEYTKQPPKTIFELKQESVGYQDYKVIHDTEYNVTCWYVSGSQIGTVGFSCVPDNQITINR